MNETTLTPEQRDRIDETIAQRILAHMPYVVNSTSVSVASMMSARSGLGLGPMLENACPYWRTCNQKENVPVTRCPKPAYRECFHYKANLLGDILSGAITSETVSQPV